MFGSLDGGWGIIVASYGSDLVGRGGRGVYAECERSQPVVRHWLLWRAVIMV